MVMRGTRRRTLAARGCDPPISPARDRDETGFTLVELLIVLLILPIVVGAAAISVITVLQDQVGVSQSYGDSSNAVITSANFVRDVESAASVSTALAPLCGSTGTQLVGLSWTAMGIATTVSYVEQGTELVRDLCSGPTQTPSSSLVVARGLSSTTLPSVTVSCDSTVPACQVNGSGVWPPGAASVTLDMQEADRTSPYQISGALRQWTPALGGVSPGGAFVPPILALGSGAPGCGSGSAVLTDTGSSQIQVNGSVVVDSMNPCSIEVTGSGSLTATQAIQTADSAVVVVSPTSANLNAISASSASAIWAVGDNCTVVYYDGTSWVSLSATPTLDAICTGSSLTGVDAHGGNPIVVGNGVAFSCSKRCTSTAATWVSLATLPGFGTPLLDAVSAGASGAWAVGTNCTVLYDNGSTWTNLAPSTTLCPSGTTLDGVAAANGNPVIVGANATLLTCTSSCTTSNAVFAADSLSGVSGAPNLRGVTYTSSPSPALWVVGDQGTVAVCSVSCSTSGATWNTQDVGLADSSNLLAVASQANGPGVRAVGSGTYVAQCGSKVSLCTATALPSPWSSEAFSTATQLNGVVFPSATSAWAVGAGGAIFSLPFALEDTGNATYGPSPDYRIPVPDPYVSLAPPAQPATTGSCGPVGSVEICSAGYYSAGLNFSSCPSGTNEVQLQSGIYYLANGFNVSGSCPIASQSGGVLLYIAGGEVSFSGSSTVSLSPLQSGNITVNLLIDQARGDCNAMTFSGSGSVSSFGGTVYAPYNSCPSPPTLTISGSPAMSFGSVITTSVSITGSGQLTLG